MVTAETLPTPARPPGVPESLLNPLSAGLFLAFTALYLATLCPTIFWGDGTEYIVTSWTLRNSHPTGFPLYNLVGKAASLLPLGTIAFRINLLSAALGAGTLVLSFRLLARFTGGWFMPLAAAATLGLSRTFWSLSTIAETLTLNLFLAALLLSMALAEEGVWRGGRLAVAFLCGLAAANHSQIVIIIAAVALVIAGRHPLRWRRMAAQVPLPALFFLMGCSVYAFLVVRSGYTYPSLYPEANTAWGFFSYYLGRSAYNGPDRLRGWSEAVGLVPQVIRSIPAQLGWPLSLLVIPGLGHLWRRSRTTALALLSVAVLTLLSAVFNGPTGNTYKMFLYSAQLYWTLALLGCFGGIWLAERAGAAGAPRWARAAVPVGCLCAAALLLRGNFPVNDLSSHDWASRIARVTFDTLPRGAIYLPGKDNPINLATYWRFVKGYRQDLAVIPQEGLMDGYFHRRLRGIYPGVELGDDRTVAALLGTGNSFEGFVLLAAYFRYLALNNPDSPVFVYPDIPEEALDLPRRPWGDTYEILLPSARRGSGFASPAGWDAFESGFARRAPPFLFDDFVIPDLADIHQRFGWHYYRQGDAERAVAEYRASVAILPTGVWLRYNFARLLHALGRFEEAERELDEALRIDPAFRPAGLLLGRVKLAAGDVDGARVLARAYRTGGDTPEFLALRGEVELAGGEAVRAAGDLGRAAAADPGNPGYLVAYGRALYAAGRDEELLAVGRSLVAEGEPFDGWYAQGLAQARLGRLSEAEGAYRTALSIRPDAFQVHNNLGVLYSLAGRNGEAARSFKSALAINPAYEPARQNLQRLR